MKEMKDGIHTWKNYPMLIDGKTWYCSNAHPAQINLQTPCYPRRNPNAILSTEMLLQSNPTDHVDPQKSVNSQVIPRNSTTTTTTKLEPQRSVSLRIIC